MYTIIVDGNGTGYEELLWELGFEQIGEVMVLRTTHREAQKTSEVLDLEGIFYCIENEESFDDEEEWSDICDQVLLRIECDSSRGKKNLLDRMLHKAGFESINGYWVSRCWMMINPSSYISGNDVMNKIDKFLCEELREKFSLVKVTMDLPFEVIIWVN